MKQTRSVVKLMKVMSKRGLYVRSRHRESKRKKGRFFFFVRKNAEDCLKYWLKYGIEELADWCEKINTKILQWNHINCNGIWKWHTRIWEIRHWSISRGWKWAQMSGEEVRYVNNHDFFTHNFNNRTIDCYCKLCAQKGHSSKVLLDFKILIILLRTVQRSARWKRNTIWLIAENGSE